jgi:hypothetical protein
VSCDPCCPNQRGKKSNKVNLVVLAFGSPMDGVEVIRVVKVIGCTKLTNQLIVPWLVKFQQLIKPHGAQVMNDLLEF